MTAIPRRPRFRTGRANVRHGVLCLPEPYHKTYMKIIRAPYRHTGARFSLSSHTLITYIMCPLHKVNQKDTYENMPKACHYTLRCPFMAKTILCLT